MRRMAANPWNASRDAALDFEPLGAGFRGADAGEEERGANE
jgi:hypothetical protein